MTRLLVGLSRFWLAESKHSPKFNELPFTKNDKPTLWRAAAGECLRSGGLFFGGLSRSLSRLRAYPTCDCPAEYVELGSYLFLVGAGGVSVAPASP